MSVDEGSYGDSGGRQRGTDPASDLDGTGGVTVDADRVGRHGQLGAVDRHQRADVGEPHAPLGDVRRIVEHGAGLGTGHQGSPVGVGPIGERLGSGGEPRSPGRRVDGRARKPEDRQGGVHCGDRGGDRLRLLDIGDEGVVQRAVGLHVADAVTGQTSEGIERAELVDDVGE